MQYAGETFEFNFCLHKLDNVGQKTIHRGCTRSQNQKAATELARTSVASIENKSSPY